MMVISLQKNDLDIEMTLTITRLFPQHFRTYYFEAANDLGREVYPIELVRSKGGGGCKQLYCTEYQYFCDCCCTDKSSESRSSSSAHTLCSLPLLLVAYIMTKIKV